MKLAKWSLEYDSATDKCYECPSCPDCGIPIFSVRDDGNGFCECCDEKITLTDSQKKWIETHYDEKEETVPCFECGKPSSVTYTKNPVNGEWRVAYGECPHCGLHFIV